MALHITCVAPINIAFIKYWGKRDEALILPLNDSYSITLDTDNFCTKTSVFASEALPADELWVNGKQVDISASARVKNVLRDVRARCEPKYAAMKVRVVSVNNFPTAAGMASSASGYCCLVFALCQLFHVTEGVSAIARVGSGSSCRSLYGGFVKWLMGSAPDGSDSLAVQGAPASHWPEMQVLILVCRSTEKDVSSTAGQQLSAATSPHMKERTTTLVPQRMVDVHSAILARDFARFASITMDEAQSLHTACLTTVPPIEYWAPLSYSVVEFVKAWNRLCPGPGGAPTLAYTFDAGPNAFLFTLKPSLVAVLKAVLTVFPTSTEVVRAPAGTLAEVERHTLPAAVEQGLREACGGGSSGKPSPGGFACIFHSGVGSGPRVLEDPKEALLDPATGERRAA
eukprot:RCo049993